jgi:hypothetical protein
MQVNRIAGCFSHHVHLVDPVSKTPDRMDRIYRVKRRDAKIP